MTSSTDMPAKVAVTQPLADRDTKFIRVAREIAMDLHELEDILKRNDVSPKQWEEMKDNTFFRKVLNSALEEWHRADNTGERVRLKALAAIEEALPEFFARMHNPTESLPAKVKSLEVFAQLAGIGKTSKAEQVGGGEKFSVTINLGADQQIKISAPTPEPRIIEGNSEY